MAVKLVKLITGEEIIADVLTERELGGSINNVYLKRAVVLVPTSRGITILPFPRHAEDGQEIKLSGEAVLFILNVHPDVLVGYNQYFGTITIPPTPKLELPPGV
jgi:hypothetical protein